MSNAIMLGWNRTTPGRERQAMEQFTEFMGWLGKQQAAKNITSFQPVILAAHGGDLNGFIMINGEGEKLDKLTNGEDWLDFMTRGGINLMGLGATKAFVGDEVATMMKRFGKHI